MATPSEFRSELEQQRPYLLRFARLQLRDEAAAEDAVQEALLAALTGEANFGGRSSLRTWLTGILKHKIIDLVRRASRETVISGDGAEEDGAGAEFDRLFRENGHWVEHPDVWSHPDAALSQTEFFAVLEGCLARLPAKTARVFMMREHLGCETEEICRECAVTPTHCWVLLHRARMALQQCLNTHWFAR